jgi:dihydrofolate synthase/folylpolyglutamate synthase
MTFVDLDAVDEFLATLVKPMAESLDYELSLANMKRLAHWLGDPQEKLRVVHVAGTSGKTSTAYYAAAFLHAAGKKVGLTVSPHLHQVNERVQINLQPLDEPTFCKAIGEFADLLAAGGFAPTYFEFMIAFAYWEFVRLGVEYAVIEVGLGGRLDATNIVERADKVCVITDIGYDHTPILGDTLAKIATEKAGIIHANQAVFSYRQPNEVRQVLRQICQQRSATLHEVMLPKQASPAQILPLFQQRNWRLACQVYEYLAERDELLEPTPELLEQTVHTYIPGRMETRRVGDKTIILDGAHNAQKMRALVQSIRAIYPNPKMPVVLALAQSKDAQLDGVLQDLSTIASHLIVTTFAISIQRDMYKTAMPPSEVLSRCRQLGITNVEAVEPADLAVERSLAGPEQTVLVAGSFYLLGSVKL